MGTLYTSHDIQQTAIDDARKKSAVARMVDCDHATDRGMRCPKCGASVRSIMIYERNGDPSVFLPFVGSPFDGPS